MAFQKFFQFVFWLALFAGYAPLRSSAVLSGCALAFKTFNKSEKDAAFFDFIPQDDILDLAGEAEKLRIEADRAGYISGARGGDRFALISASSSDLMENILEHERMDRGKFKELKAKLKDLKAKLSAASKTSDLLKNSRAEWRDLIENPSLLEPDTFYPVTFLNGQSAVFVFNKKVADQFFNPNNKAYNEKLAKRLLAAAGRGFVSRRANLSGLRFLRQARSGKRLIQYNDLLEIRGVGDSLGHIRIGGFKVNNQIHWVHYAISSDHRKIRKRFIGQLLNRYSSHNSLSGL